MVPANASLGAGLSAKATIPGTARFLRRPSLSAPVPSIQKTSGYNQSFKQKISASVEMVLKKVGLFLDPNVT
jgi:hypothetical protein